MRKFLAGRPRFVSQGRRSQVSMNSLSALWFWRSDDDIESPVVVHVLQATEVHIMLCVYTYAQRNCPCSSQNWLQQRFRTIQCSAALQPLAFSSCETQSLSTAASLLQPLLCPV
jgi:hypothetical protein